MWCNTTCVWQRLRHVCRRCRCLILSQSKSLTRSSARPLECPLRRRLAFWQAFFLGKSSRNRQAKMVADARVAQVYSAAAAACKRSRQTDRRTDERATSARTHKALISSRRRDERARLSRLRHALARSLVRPSGAQVSRAAFELPRRRSAGPNCARVAAAVLRVRCRLLRVAAGCLAARRTDARSLARCGRQSCALLRATRPRPTRCCF